MKEYLIFLLSFILMSNHIQAQDNEDKNPADTVKAWKTNGLVSLTFSQVGLSNWAAGGQSSFSGNGMFQYFANYKKDKKSWDNSIILAYGLLKQEGQGLNKNDDKIELISKFGHQASKKWYYALDLTFRSQFDEGYKTIEDTVKISDFMAPGYLIISLGMDYKPNENFTLLLSPMTSKLTFVMDDFLSSVGAYGVNPGENARSEIGGYIKLIYKKPGLVKNVDFTTNLDLFSNYVENPQYIDVNWEMFIDMKVNDFLFATFKTHLIYDYDIKFINEETGAEEDRIQFKEIIGFGITYKF